MQVSKSSNTYTTPSRKAQVQFNPEWAEYTVVFWKHGKIQSGANYHTSDKSDAHGTAKHWVNQPE